MELVSERTMTLKGFYSKTQITLEARRGGNQKVQMATPGARSTYSITCFSKALGTSLLSSDKLLLIRSRRRFSIICEKQTKTKEGIFIMTVNSKEKKLGSFR